METQLKSGIALINFHHAENVSMPSVKSTYTIPDPHLSHTGSFCAFPTDDPIFVEGAFTLRKPDGLSESPTKEHRNMHTHARIILAHENHNNIWKAQKNLHLSPESPEAPWMKPIVEVARQTLGSPAASCRLRNLLQREASALSERTLMELCKTKLDV